MSNQDQAIVFNKQNDNIQHQVGKILLHMLTNCYSSDKTG